MCCLFIGIGEVDHIGVVIGSAKEGNPAGQVVRGETSWHDNRRYEYQERINMRRAPLVDIRWGLSRP